MRAKNDRRQRNAARNRSETDGAGKHDVHRRRAALTDFASRIMPGVIAATVLVGAGQVITPEGSVEQATAGTDIRGAEPAEVALVKPVTGAMIRSASAPSRSGTRPMLSSIGGGGLQRVAAFGGESALASAATASSKVERKVARELRNAAFTFPIRGARITSGYGQRWGRMHHGMDFGAEVGHRLFAVTDATVTTASYNSGLGYHLRITLADGTEVSYGHLSKISVDEGDVVRSGAVIGRVGNSGSSTGAHLHFEVRGPDGDRVNPRPWLTRRGLL